MIPTERTQLYIPTCSGHVSIIKRIQIISTIVPSDKVTQQQESQKLQIVFGKGKCQVTEDKHEILSPPPSSPPSPVNQEQTRICDEKNK